MKSVDTIPYLTVFAQGLLSFFSPCVLPLLPLYIGYLSGGGTKRDEDGALQYDRKRTLINTIFFVIGISFAFFVLTMGMSALGMFFRTKQMWLVRIGGGLIVLFGLYQLGVLGESVIIEKERRLPFRLDRLSMSPITALLMGFVFSFAWTPCVGPTLSSVLLMAATAQTRASGLMLIGIYTLGFVLPFLAVGLFTTSLLKLFKEHQGLVRYTVKIGGVLLIALGLMMLSGKMNSITGYLSKISGSQPVANASVASDGSEEDHAQTTSNGVTEDAGSDAQATSDSEVEDNTKSDAEATSGSSTEEAAESDAQATADSTKESSESDAKEDEDKKDVYPAPDFELSDQFGNTHTLADYRGKVIFLNFWATWCPPCRHEMPDIQRLYEKYQGAEATDGTSTAVGEESEVVVLGVAFPDHGGEGSVEDISNFLSENGYTYPVLMDTSAELAAVYGISAYPTTYMIDRDGNLFGYVTGAIDGSMMESIVQQTLAG